MSKTRGLPEVLVEINECRQMHSVGSMIQPLHNSGFFRYSLKKGTYEDDKTDSPWWHGGAPGKRGRE